MKELLLALGGTGAAWLVLAVRLRFRRRHAKGKPRWEVDVDFDPSRLFRLPWWSKDD